MQCEAGPEVKQLGLVFNALPPGKIEVKAVTADSWADQVGFAGGEEILEMNAVAPADMTEDKFREIIKSRPLTIKFQQAETVPPPSPRPSQPGRLGSSDKLEEEVTNLMSMPGSFKYVGGMIAMVRSSLKAAGMKKYGIRWTKIFLEQDTGGSGRISWEQFHATCRDVLSTKEQDVQLRMVFRCMGEDPSKDVNLDDLVSFLQDPVQRMRTRFKTATAQLTVERWYEILEENPVAWNFTAFTEMCRDNLGLTDLEVHLWLVYRHLAGNDTGTIAPDQIRGFISDDGKPPQRPSLVVKSKSERRASSRSIRQQVMARANSTKDDDDDDGTRSRASSVASRQHSIRSTNSQEEREIVMTADAEDLITRKEVSLMCEKMKLHEVEFPNIEQTTIGTLDQTVFAAAGKKVLWLGLTGEDWVVVSTRERGEPDFLEANDATVVKNGTRIVFIHRPSAVAHGYATFAENQARSRDVLARMAPNETLGERITLCRTNHVFKSRGGEGRVSVAFDNSYVVLPGAKLLERDGETVTLGYQPMDRIISNCGKVSDSRDTPELDFFYFTEELVGQGSRLGPKKGKIEGIDLHGEHGLNVIGLARKLGNAWDLQWCPTVDFFAQKGDVCLTTRRREAERPSVPGLVHVAAVAAANSI